MEKHDSVTDVNLSTLDMIEPDQSQKTAKRQIKTSATEELYNPQSQQQSIDSSLKVVELERKVEQLEQLLYKALANNNEGSLQLVAQKS